MEVFVLSRHQMDRLREEAVKWRKQEQAGYPVKRIIKEMYCQFYPDKTEAIGFVIADKVMQYVREYSQEVRQARENFTQWYDQKVQQILEGSDSCKKRCHTLYKVRMELIAAEIAVQEGQEAAKTYRNTHLYPAFFSEEATDQLEQKLKAELKKTLEQNRVFPSLLNVYAKKAANTMEERTLAAIPYGEEDWNWKAILAMKAYLESGEDGYLKRIIPEDASLEAITYSICASEDALSVIGAAEDDKLESSTAMELIHAIGRVVGGIVALHVSVALGMSAAVTVESGVLAVMGGILITVAVAEAIMEPVMKAGEVLADTTKEIVSFGIKWSYVTGKKLLFGIQKWIASLGNFTDFANDVKQDRIGNRANEKEVQKNVGNVFEYV